MKKSSTIFNFTRFHQELLFAIFLKFDVINIQFVKFSILYKIFIVLYLKTKITGHQAPSPIYVKSIYLFFFYLINEERTSTFYGHSKTEAFVGLRKNSSDWFRCRSLKIFTKKIASLECNVLCTYKNVFI